MLIGGWFQERNAITDPELVYDLQHHPNTFRLTLHSGRITKVFPGKSGKSSSSSGGLLSSDTGSPPLFFTALQQLVLPTDGRYHRVSAWRGTGAVFAKAVPRPLSVMREIKFRLKEDPRDQDWTEKTGVQKLVEVFELDLQSSHRLRHRVYLHVRQTNRQVAQGWDGVVLEAEQMLVRMTS